MLCEENLFNFNFPWPILPFSFNRGSGPPYTFSLGFKIPLTTVTSNARNREIELQERLIFRLQHDLWTCTGLVLKGKVRTNLFACYSNRAQA